MATDSEASEPELGREGLLDGTKNLEYFDTKGTNDSVSFSDIESQYLFVCDADCKLSTKEKTVSMLCSDVDSTEEEVESNNSYRLDSVNGNDKTEKGMEEVGPDEDVGLPTNYLSIDDSNDLTVQPKGGKYSDIFENSYQIQSPLLSEIDKAIVTKRRTSPNADINNNTVPTESLNLMVWDSDDSEQRVQVLRTPYNTTELSLNAYDKVHTSPQDVDEIESKTSLGQTDMKASGNIETTAEATRNKLSTEMTSTEPFSSSDTNECTKTDILKGTIIEQNRLVPGTDWTEIFSVSCTTEYIDTAEWTNLSPRMKEHGVERVTGDSETVEMHHSESTHDKTSQAQLKGEISSRQDKPDKASLFSSPSTAKDNLFRCYECDRTFSKRCSLTRHHRATHEGMGHLSCEICDFSAKIESKFRKHSRIVHNNPKPFKCNFQDCKVAFSEYYRLVDHKKIHGDEKEFVCGYPECMFSCHKRHALLVHQRLHIKRNHPSLIRCHDSHIQDQQSDSSKQNELTSSHIPHADKTPHSPRKLYNCTKCEKICLTKSGLSNHVHKIHFGLAHLKCGFCGISTKTEKRLRKHCLDHHGNVRPFVCDHPGCGYQARRYCALTTHQKLHMSKAIRQNEFNSWADGSSHPQVCTHKPKRSFEAVYKCQQCHLQYLRLEDLSRHVQRVHHDSSHLRCRFCNTSMQTEKQLTQHCINVHDIRHPFQCVHANCHYSTDKYFRLKNHDHQVHSDRKDYICEKCGKTFSTRRNLSSHKQACLHLQEYLCDKCGKTFDRLRCLNTHIHAIHFGERPHVCKHCGKLFDQKSNLKRHLLIHEKAFPFICHICDRKFRHSNTLKGHMKKHGEGACVHGSLKTTKPDREDNGSQERFFSCHQINIEDINFPKRTISKTGENGSLEFIIRTVKAADCEKNMNKSSQSTQGVGINTDMSRKLKKPVSNDVHTSQVIAKSNSKSRNCKRAVLNRNLSNRKLNVSCESFDEFRPRVKSNKKIEYKNALQSTKARRVFKAFRQFAPCTKVMKMKSMWTAPNEEADQQSATAKWPWKQNKQVTTTTVKTHERNLKDISHHDISKGRKKCQRRAPLKYTCAQCQTAFKDRGLLTAHLRTIHADIYNFSCRLCSFTSETIAAIRNHYLGDHKRVRAFECDFPSCTYNTNKIQRLLKHQRRHPKNGHEDAIQCDPRGRNLSCKYCGFIYMSMKMLEEHYAEVHVNCRPFHCTIQGCGYNTARMRRLQLHYKQHAKEEEQLQKNKTSNVGSLRRGLSETSKPTVPLYSHHCLHCEARFMRQADLSRHIQNTHTDSSHLRCRFCSISAKSVKKLQRHCDEVHDNRHPFQCISPDCNFVSRRFHELKKHQFRIHTQTKEFLCESCGASFKTTYDLSNHTRSCLDLQEFICDACGQTFNHLQSLQIHHRTVHDGLKPFNCSQCGKSFGDRSNLRRHIRIHKNMFPYSCNVCGRAFRHSNSLKSHMDTHGEVFT